MEMKFSKIALAGAIGGAGYLYGRSKTKNKNKTPDKEVVDQEEAAPVNLLRLANFQSLNYPSGGQEEDPDPFIFGQGFVAGEVFNANKEWLESMVVSEEAAESFLSFWRSEATKITKGWKEVQMIPVIDIDPDAENRRVLLENQFYGALAELAFTHSLELIASMRHISGVPDDKLLEGYSGDRVVYEAMDALVYHDGAKNAPGKNVYSNTIGMFESTFGGKFYGTMRDATERPVPSHRALCAEVHYDALKGVLLKFYKTPFLGVAEYLDLVELNYDEWKALSEQH